MSAQQTIQNLDELICVDTEEPRISLFLFQRLSVANRKGNAACVVGTEPVSRGLGDIKKWFDFYRRLKHLYNVHIIVL